MVEGQKSDRGEGTVKEIRCGIFKKKLLSLHNGQGLEQENAHLQLVTHVLYYDSSRKFGER